VCGQRDRSAGEISVLVEPRRIVETGAASAAEHATPKAIDGTEKTSGSLLAVLPKGSRSPPVRSAISVHDQLAKREEGR
jgi:hypothetical protein